MLFEKIDQEYIILIDSINEKINEKKTEIEEIEKNIFLLKNKDIDIKYFWDWKIFRIKDDFFWVEFNNKNTNINILFDSWKKEITKLINIKNNHKKELLQDVDLLEKLIPNIRDVVEISLVMNKQWEADINYACKSKKYSKFNLLQNFETN